MIKNRNPLIEAAELARNGHHTKAAAIYQREANKERPVSEKKSLWKQADHCRKQRQ